MVRVQSESNIDLLRQTAMLLESENTRLHCRLVELTRRLALAEGAGATQLEFEIVRLQEELAARTRKIFGQSSEKRGQGKDKQSNPPAAPTPPATGHGPREQLALPRTEQVHKLDVPDQMCPKCGGDLKEWEGQFEDSEEIDVVERSFRVVRHRRQKYRCQCASCVETALGPRKLIEGGRYSIDFAVGVAVDKYADHLPLARQVKQMARQGLVIDSQTLWDQILALSRHLQPSYEALCRYVRSRPVIGADETTWRMMETDKTSKWWVWTLSCADAVCYRILGSRSAKAAGTILAEYDGIVMADGYGAYTALQKEITATANRKAFDLAHCWAHVRRKFYEAQPNYAQAGEVLDLIAELYAIDAGVRSQGLDPAEASERLLEARREQSAPVVEKIRQWLSAQGLTALPQSALGKAISYPFGIWPGLTKFLTNPAIPLDNNATERAIRGVAVGRKNHYGSRSLRGTEVAALFYTLIESAKLVGVNPVEYLRTATHRAIDNPGTITLPTTTIDTG
jgi:transposase